MDRQEKAKQIFGTGLNCAQSVFSVFADEQGVTEEQAKLIGSAYGGGIATTGKICGAVNGALMAIGLRCGYKSGGETERKKKTYNLARRFMEEFTRKNGSIICNELLGFDISDEALNRKAAEDCVYRTLCPKLVADAVEIVEKIS